MFSVARAFQPEICAAAAVQPGHFAGSLLHAKPRGETDKVGVRWAVRRAADGSPRVRGLAEDLTPIRAGRCGATDFFSPRMNTDFHGCRCVFRSAVFPARDLRCCGCAAGALFRQFASREAARGNRQGRCQVGGQASRGRKSAGASPVSCCRRGSAAAAQVFQASADASALSEHAGSGCRRP